MLSKILSFSKSCLFSKLKPIAPFTVQYRNPNAKDIQFFRSFLQPNEILTEKDDVQKYNIDQTRTYKGYSQLVLLPNTTEKVSKILRYCNEQIIPVVPQSGNTGLVGGSVPVKEEVVVSLTKLNKILSYDQNTNVITIESGCVIDQLNEYLKPFNTEIPISLGSKGSCCIGGNISTHAGGKFFYKYGQFRTNILGMEVVLPSGEILDMMSQVRKDNTGMDLKQLFIGAEGTLGLITKANILCQKKSKMQRLMLIKCNKFEQVLFILKKAKEMGRDLSGCEFIDSQSFKYSMEFMQGAYNPFNSLNNLFGHFYMLVELSSNHDIEILQDQFFQTLNDAQSFEDCILAENEQQFEYIWKIREQIGACTTRAGYVFKYDLSMDPAIMTDFTLDIRKRTEKYANVAGFGHIGDGNLHVNVICHDKKYADTVRGLLEPYIFEKVTQVKGSISAEHGIGKMKVNYLHLQKSPLAIQIMKGLKNIFDPNQILNPYKYLP